MTLTLREFKVKQLTVLNQLESELVSKYPEKAEKVRHVVDTIKGKLDRLRRFTLYDYLRTVDTFSREFPELKRLLPSPEEVHELLETSNR